MTRSDHATEPSGYEVGGGVVDIEQLGDLERTNVALAYWHNPNEILDEIYESYGLRCAGHTGQLRRFPRLERLRLVAERSEHGEWVDAARATTDRGTNRESPFR